MKYLQQLDLDSRWCRTATPSRKGTDEASLASPHSCLSGGSGTSANWEEEGPGEEGQCLHQVPLSFD